MDFVLQQDEEETESEVEEDIFLMKGKKVEDKIGKQKQQEEDVVVVNEKLKRDGNQQKESKSNMMKARVITADEPPKCKKTDGRKWSCRSIAALLHTLCEKHLRWSRSL